MLLRTAGGAEKWVQYADLGGIALEGSGVTLFVGGSAWRLQHATGDTVTRILERACKVPELTRSSRHLGSPSLPTVPGAERLLQLLLGARRELAGQRHPLAQARTFDAAGLASAVRGIAAELARDCYPASQPESRALEWRLLEILDPLLRALEEVSRAGSALVASAPTDLLKHWRRWVACVAAVFAATDRLWPDFVQLLAKAREGSLSAPRGKRRSGR
ncbi:MAG TPA: hypothetical protein VNL96_06800 [Gemmatimonadaceae bacterium]|nr:hypothetical protein [Gemmatimonadaceae bacterium]